MYQEECSSANLHIVAVDLTDWEATRFTTQGRYYCLQLPRINKQVSTVSSAKNGRISEQRSSCDLHTLPWSHPWRDWPVSRLLFSPQMSPTLPPGCSTPTWSRWSTWRSLWSARWSPRSSLERWSMSALKPRRPLSATTLCTAPPRARWTWWPSGLGKWKTGKFNWANPQGGRPRVWPPPSSSQRSQPYRNNDWDGKGELFLKSPNVFPTIKGGLVWPCKSWPYACQDPLGQVRASIKLHLLKPTLFSRFAEVDDVVQCILFLLGPGSSLVNGITMPVDGGFLAT